MVLSIFDQSEMINMLSIFNQSGYGVLDVINDVNYSAKYSGTIAVLEFIFSYTILT